MKPEIQTKLGNFKYLMNAADKFLTDCEDKNNEKLAKKYLGI